jgi:nucleoside-diphosphate-sugar epimerase
MKVLVTGATGFIGNYVVGELLKQNCDVIATSSREQKASQAAWFDQVKYLPFNFENFNESTDYFSFFDKPEIAIHLAWEGLPNYKSSFHEEQNLSRHLAFLTNLVQHGLKDLTVTGTCFEYGMQEGCLQEDMPAKPENPYGKAKDTLRRELEKLNQACSFSFKWIRLFYMYGKGQNPNSLLSQLERALANNEPVFNMSGGEQVRDFLPVEKVAAHIVAIALQKKVTGIINCCSGEPVTVKKFVEDYLREKDKKIELNFGFYPYPDYEPASFWGDTTRLNEISF